MYILGIGPESLPTTLRVDYIRLCSQLFFCTRLQAGHGWILTVMFT